jgi:hypothetical protein
MMDKAADMQINVGVLDPDFFTSTNNSQHSGLVIKEIASSMHNDYVVGAYYTGHWVTL